MDDVCENSAGCVMFRNLVMDKPGSWTFPAYQSLAKEGIAEHSQTLRIEGYANCSMDCLIIFATVLSLYDLRKSN